VSSMNGYDDVDCITAMGFANVLTNRDVTLSVRDMVGYREGIVKNCV
jgi:hypothetical protein